jgi:hypothetical protein
MSALPPIATEQRTQFYVGFVPTTDSCTAAIDHHSIISSRVAFLTRYCASSTGSSTNTSQPTGVTNA